MKKGILLVWLIMISVSILSQESEKSGISEKSNVIIGLNGGYGLNMNAYRFTENTEGFSYYGIGDTYSIGFDFGVFVTNRFRPRIDLGYVEMSYGTLWPEIYEMEKTIVTLYMFGMNLHFDYLLLSGSHFQLFASPGLITEFVGRDQYKNILDDGNYNHKRYNVFSEQYPNAIAGGNASVIAKYKINAGLGITLTPGYTCFFKKYHVSNDKPYQRITVNFGIEYTF